ncbi:GNAT family N-acetyltransferase [Sediminitomix flava]|uniref:Acetyltransferase (GNAT) family protein n=1 Tax=Sediminitomix flava TaxID=379075 RepID=A0A315Z8I0_SEDFL|nr:GNAT family N-acetyltransferase [Sediminitomix flava]PWJ41056.1 acetyltransferase (GNAT) family protein [Sediminitomix flava]
MSTSITEITPEQTWGLRQRVMWPNKPLDYVKLSADQHGKHYGLWQNDNLVSVVSLFINGHEAQFRKLATEVIEQGNGFGSSLLSFAMEQAQANGVKKIWCNARLDKISFYKDFGLELTNETYEKDGVDYVIMEKAIMN